MMGALALLVTRRGHALMACTLLLPMTLSLAASCSQDGLLIACTALAAACVTRAAEMRVHTWSGWHGGAWLLLALLIVSKPPYAPLAALLLLPLHGGNVGLRAGLAALAVLPGAMWLAVETRLVMTPILRPATEAGPLWPGQKPAVFTGPDVGAQLHVLAAAPWRVVALPLRAIWGGAAELLHQLVGVLDYLCLWLPSGLYDVWFLALAASLLAAMASRAEPAGWGHGLVAWGAASLCVIAIGDAQYVQWTPVGMDWIGGIQGRYFLPLVPVLAIGLPSLGFGRLAKALSFVTVAAACVTAVWLPGLIDVFYPMAP